MQEIRSYEAPTCVAHAPSFVKGVVNLRGVIVPILTCASAWPAQRVQRLHRRHQAERGRPCGGIVVDSVSDVLEPSASEIKTRP